MSSCMGFDPSGDGGRLWDDLKSNGCLTFNSGNDATAPVTTDSCETWRWWCISVMVLLVLVVVTVATPSLLC